MKLIAIGDNVTDCYMDEGVYFPGGNAVNVAVNCKKNGAEKVNYIGVFGDDERADYIKQCLTEEGVTYDRSRKVYAHTAQPRVYLKDGDRVFAPGLRDSCQHLFSIKIVKEDEEIINRKESEDNPEGLSTMISAIPAAIPIWSMSWKSWQRSAAYRSTFLRKETRSTWREPVRI